MSYDVICVGSALLDIFVKSEKFKKIPNGEYADGIALCEEYGGKTEVEEMVVCSGGAGTNAAVSFARKGLRTALVAEVGRDLVAGTIKQELVREDVDLMMLSEVEGEVTGMSVILVAPDGGRSALIARGASKMLTNEDILWDKLNTKWLYVSSLGGELWLMQSLIGHTRDHNLKIAINPGKGEIEAIKRMGAKAGEIFDGVEVLMVNKEEGEQLFGGEPPEKFGAKYTVITDGRNGGKVYREAGNFEYKSKLVPVVEETGAGDAFGTGLVAGLIMDKEIDEAVDWGIRQAASVVSFMGAKRGLLSVNQLTG